jgi:hypothetical protein
LRKSGSRGDCQCQQDRSFFHVVELIDSKSILWLLAKGLTPLALMLIKVNRCSPSKGFKLLLSGC